MSSEIAAAKELPSQVGGKSTDSPGHVVIPVECIDAIVEYLWEEMATMHALLRSSRTLFLTTIPVLYRDPFKLIFKRRDPETMGQRLAHLLRLLWRCSLLYNKQQLSATSNRLDTDSTSSHHSNLTEASLETDALREFPTPTVDYLAYYTDQSLIERVWSSIQYLFATKTWSSQARLRQTAAIASCVFTTAFFEHRPSMIRTLCMSPTQLGLLVQRDEQGGGESPLSNLARLKCLELDISPSKSSVDLAASWQFSPFDNIPPPASLQMNKLDIPLQFVQLHQKRFKGTLKDIVVRGSDASWSPLDHLLCHVDPMRLVDLSAWNSPLPTFEQLPISELQVLRLNMPRRLDWSGVTPAFLQTCTNLREIWTSTQHPTLFQQAVPDEDESATMLPALNAVESTMSAASSTLEPLGTGDVDGVTSHWSAVALNIGNNGEEIAGAPSLPTRFLSLRAIRLYGLHQHIVPNFLTVLKTCQKLSECVIVEDGVGRKADYPQKIQWDWPMEHLTFLSLQGRFVYFVDLSSLLQCPLLCTLHLIVESSLPPATQNQLTTLAKLKRLEEIRLRGTPWQLDTDTILEIGQGLSQTLRHLDIMDSMHPTTTGLAKLTHVAVRLEILKLGVPYLQVKTRLLAMARPNVKIVFSMEQ